VSQSYNVAVGYVPILSFCDTTMRSPIPDDLRPILRIGAVAELLEVHPRTLRLYEQRGLLKPVRSRGQRKYTPNDVRWLRCLRTMVHEHGYSLPGIAKLLDLAPCWEIKNCPPEVRDTCEAKVDARLPCWAVMKGRCARGARSCEGCSVYEARDQLARSR
jgi:MerR family transcriptional regulator, heat shock protein HspR